jgi:hypothetical protein
MQKAKLILCIVFLLFIFLPLGSCEKNKPIVANEPEIDAESIIQQVAPKKSVDRVTTNKPDTIYITPIREFILDEPESWLFVFIFVWPSIFCICKRYYGPEGRKRIAVTLSELILSSFSFYYLYLILFRLFYVPTILGYLSLFTLTIIFVQLIAELYNDFSKLRNMKI